MKGKSWSLEDEEKLKDQLNSIVSVDVLVFSFDGQYFKDAFLRKLERLGLEVVVVEKKFTSTTTSKLELPEELPNVEEALKILVSALKGLEMPRLDKGAVCGCTVKGSNARIRPISDQLLNMLE